MDDTMGGIPVDLATWQREADGMIRSLPDGYWPPLANLARLTEEVGELARAVNVRVGPKRRKPGEGEADIALEMGDILFVLAVLANQLEVDLDGATADVLAKYRRRDLAGTADDHALDESTGGGCGDPNP